MKINRTKRIIDFIIFILIGGFFTVSSIALLGEPLPERYYYYFTLLITAFMIFLYLRSHKLNLDSKWFKASFTFRIISLLFPLITFLTFVILTGIYGPLGWGGLGLIVYGFFPSWFAYVISIILFAIGYYKSRGRGR